MPDNSTRQEEAKRYQALKNRLMLISLALQGALLCLAIAAGWTWLFKAWAGFLGRASSPWALVFFYFLIFSFYLLLLEFPLNVYSGYVLEKRFGLSAQNFKGWLWQDFKKQILSFLFSAVLVEALYFLLRSFPENWWLFAWAGWFAVTVLIGKFAVVLFLPLFYKSTRLEDERLRGKITGLLEKYHFPVKDIYVINLSKTTRKANAAFTGIGSTRRVLLADTLLAHFTHDEIETVVAHELGHCKKRHLVKGVIYNTAVSFGVFYAAFLALKHWAVPLGFESPADIAAFPLLGLVTFAAGLILMPAGNAYSRFHETEADDFALKECPDRGAFISALKKLGSQNLADFEPHPLIEFFLYSHPSLGKRISRAEKS